jgi:hypothetical protein
MISGTAGKQGAISGTDGTSASPGRVAVVVGAAGKRGTMLNEE